MNQPVASQWRCGSFHPRFGVQDCIFMAHHQFSHYLAALLAPGHESHKQVLLTRHFTTFFKKPGRGHETLRCFSFKSFLCADQAIQARFTNICNCTRRRTKGTQTLIPDAEGFFLMKSGFSRIRPSSIRLRNYQTAFESQQNRCRGHSQEWESMSMLDQDTRMLHYGESAISSIVLLSSRPSQERQIRCLNRWRR